VVTSQLTGTGWIFFWVSLAAAVTALAFVVLPPTDQRLARWASHHGLATTERNRDLVARYLRTTRSLQIGGAALGWLASPLYIGLLGRPFPLGDSWVVLAIAGYLVGTVAAEGLFLKQRRPAAAIRAAVLARRTLSNYVPAATIWAIRILPAVTVILAVVYAVVPKDPQRSVDPGVSFLAGASILVIALALVIDGLLRAIVARSQPATTTDLMAADDAIRTSSIRALSAAGVALILLSAGWALVSVGTVTSVTQLSQVLPWCGAAFDVIALVAWIGLGHLTAWRVQRGAPVAGGG
jgi:uncharacterized membrane protein